LIGVLSIYYNRDYALPLFTSIAVDDSEINACLGTYASAGFPLKITISRAKNTLMAEATGQSSFPLEARGNKLFVFDPAGIEITFNMANDGFTLRQSGRTYVFIRESR
jgi:hypothetical protein